MLSETNSVELSKPVKIVIRLKLFDNLSHILHTWIQRKKKKDIPWKCLCIKYQIKYNI